MMEVSFNLGLLIGPLVSGGLSETRGYYYMNCVMCKSSVSSRRRIEYRLISVSHDRSARRYFFLYLSPAVAFLAMFVCAPSLVTRLSLLDTWKFSNVLRYRDGNLSETKA